MEDETKNRQAVVEALERFTERVRLGKISVTGFNFDRPLKNEDGVLKPVGPTHLHIEYYPQEKKTHGTL